MSSNSFSIAATHKSSSSLTFVSIFGTTDQTITELIRYLVAASSMIATPMLVPTLMKEIFAHYWTEYVEKCHQEIFDVEMSTKMRKGLADIGVTIVEETTPDWSKIDLVDITRSLNSVCTKIAFSSLQCRTSLRLLNFLGDMTQSFSSKAVEDNGRINKVSFAHDSLSLRNGYLQSWFEGLETRCSYLAQRAQAQVQTVSKGSGRRP